MIAHSRFLVVTAHRPRPVSAATGCRRRGCRDRCCHPGEGFRRPVVVQQQISVDDLSGNFARGQVCNPCRLCVDSGQLHTRRTRRVGHRLARPTPCSAAANPSRSRSASCNRRPPSHQPSIDPFSVPGPGNTPPPHLRLPHGRENARPSGLLSAHIFNRGRSRCSGQRTVRSTSQPAEHELSQGRCAPGTGIRPKLIRVDGRRPGRPRNGGAMRDRPGSPRHVTA